MTNWVKRFINWPTWEQYNFDRYFNTSTEGMYLKGVTSLVTRVNGHLVCWINTIAGQWTDNKTSRKNVVEFAFVLGRTCNAQLLLSHVVGIITKSRPTKVGKTNFEFQTPI